MSRFGGCEPVQGAAVAFQAVGMPHLRHQAVGRGMTGVNRASGGSGTIDGMGREARERRFAQTVEMRPLDPDDPRPVRLRALLEEVAQAATEEERQMAMDRHRETMLAELQRARLSWWRIWRAARAARRV